MTEPQRPDGPDTGDDAVSAVEANLPADDPRGNPAAAHEGGATWGETDPEQG